MSLAGDARDCLIGAVRTQHNVDIEPEDLNDLRPSDPEIGAQDALAWKRVLSVAASCLRDAGYAIGEPSRARAGDLLGSILVDSQLYLEDLCGRSDKRLAAVVVTGATIAAVGAVAIAVGSSKRRARR